MTDSDLLDYLQSKARYGESVWDAARRLLITEAARRTQGVNVGRFAEMARILRCSARAVQHYARGSICSKGCTEGKAYTHRHAPLVEVDVTHGSHWRDVPVL